MPTTTPDWVKDAIFYQIFPDRFATSERVTKPTNLEPWDSPPTHRGFKGGDFVGIQEHLDYLTELGITAIYFNPIFQSAANHRYHTYDYYEVDPILGGTTAFRDFLGAAHSHGIRVVLDGVFNHASRGFFQFNHIMENGKQSPYLDWFLVNGFPLRAYDVHSAPNYAAWWNNRELPKLNTDVHAVRAFIMDVAETWLRFGIDGWRLDVPLEITTPGFWEEFRQRVKSVNPEAYILAEIWHDAEAWLSGDHFDATMNYGFNRACYGFFGGDWLDVSHRPGGFPIERLDGPAFAEAVDHLISLYDWETTLVQYNLLSSHDEPRFTTMVRGDTRRFRLATLFQMVFPGVPSVYYGDEIGMEGGPDPDCRRAFPWDERNWDAGLRAEVRRFIALRRDHVALRRGKYTTLHVGEATYALARHMPEDVVVIAFNVSGGPKSLTLELSEALGSALPPGSSFTDPWSGAILPVQSGHLHVDIPALDGRVLVCRRS
ncbi:MAG: alpha-amylase [Anaerolineae bacterium]|nr:alpha-amylase [Anaerolineae bacterium]